MYFSHLFTIVRYLYPGQKILAAFFYNKVKLDLLDWIYKYISHLFTIIVHMCPGQKVLAGLFRNRKLSRLAFSRVKPFRGVS